MPDALCILFYKVVISTTSEGEEVERSRNPSACVHTFRHQTGPVCRSEGLRIRFAATHHASASNRELMRYHFRSEQWLSYPVEDVFRFFSNPNNLPLLMPDWQKARIDRSTLTPAPPYPLQPIGSPVAGTGSRITLSFRPIPLSPLRVSWDAEIDQFAWNDYFCDLQLRGPFRYWHHCHRVFPETRNETHGTLLRDDLHYEMPLGPLGQLANWVAVRGQIRSTFAFRHRRTRELLRFLRANPYIDKNRSRGFQDKADSRGVYLQPFQRVMRVKDHMKSDGTR